MIKQRIVQFNNGKYGIQKYFLIPFFNLGFVDLKTRYSYKWKQGDKYFSDSMGTLEEVKKKYCACGNNIKVVKVIEVSCDE